MGVQCRRKESSRSLSHLMMSFLLALERFSVAVITFKGHSGLSAATWFNRSLQNVTIRRNSTQTSAVSTVSSKVP